MNELKIALSLNITWSLCSQELGCNLEMDNLLDKYNILQQAHLPV